MVVLSWLFPRAAFWLLDRDGIKGHYGENQITPPADDEDDEEDGEPEPPKGIGAVDVPDRHIYCLDLRDSQQSSAVRRRGPPHRRRVPGAARGEAKQRARPAGDGAAGSAICAKSRRQAARSRRSSCCSSRSGAGIR